MSYHRTKLASDALPQSGVGYRQTAVQLLQNIAATFRPPRGKFHRNDPGAFSFVVAANEQVVATLPAAYLRWRIARTIHSEQNIRLRHFVQRQ